jgi:4'-phosphopantetheinyl transferase EntD
MSTLAIENDLPDAPFGDFSPPSSEFIGVIKLGLLRRDAREHAVLAWSRDCYDELERVQTAILDVKEQCFYKRLSPKRKRTFLLGRNAAKLAVASLAGKPGLTSVCIHPGVFSQPVVVAELSHPVGVSITHDENEAFAVAFPAGHPMGIDVEIVEENKYIPILSQLTDYEIDQGERLPVQRISWLTVAWTAKEALSKVLRCGLTCPFHMLEVRSMQYRDDCYWGVFSNFPQYQYVSRRTASGSMLTLVFPKQTALGWI